MINTLSSKVFCRVLASQVLVATNYVFQAHIDGGSHNAGDNQYGCSAFQMRQGKAEAPGEINNRNGNDGNGNGFNFTFLPPDCQGQSLNDNRPDNTREMVDDHGMDPKQTQEEFEKQWRRNQDRLLAEEIQRRNAQRNQMDLAVNPQMNQIDIQSFSGLVKALFLSPIQSPGVQLPLGATRLVWLFLKFSERWLGATCGPVVAVGLLMGFVHVAEKQLERDWFHNTMNSQILSYISSTQLIVSMYVVVYSLLYVLFGII
jgi:hypothetical protein